jgi:RNA polymerase-associated protein RTF1
LIVQGVSQGASSSSANSSSSESESSSSSESLKFDDGWDDDLIGDEEDRKRLEQMTEAEREQEMFNRSVETL